MSIKEFLKNKISLLEKDKQFTPLIKPLEQMVEKEASQKTIKIEPDGNWFKLSFDAVEVKKDRLVVITAEREKDGHFQQPINGANYVVQFKGTRAAYLRGYYHPNHRAGGWPFIS